jgi:hypothetical protein
MQTNMEHVYINCKFQVQTALTTTPLRAQNLDEAKKEIETMITEKNRQIPMTAVIINNRKQFAAICQREFWGLRERKHKSRWMMIDTNYYAEETAELEKLDELIKTHGEYIKQKLGITKNDD